MLPVNPVSQTDKKSSKTEGSDDLVTQAEKKELFFYN